MLPVARYSIIKSIISQPSLVGRLGSKKGYGSSHIRCSYQIYSALYFGSGYSAVINSFLLTYQDKLISMDSERDSYQGIFATSFVPSAACIVMAFGGVPLNWSVVI